MSKKIVKEAGNYKNLTQGEKMMLGQVSSPDLRNAIANGISQKRARGRQTDPVKVARELMELPHFSDAESQSSLQNFAKVNQNLVGLTNTPKTNPFARPVTPPPPEHQSLANSLPKSAKNTPADEFAKLLQPKNKGNTSAPTQTQDQPTDPNVWPNNARAVYDHHKQRVKEDPGAASSANFKGVKPPGITDFVQNQQQKVNPFSSTGTDLRARLSKSQSLGKATIPGKKAAQVQSGPPQSQVPQKLSTRERLLKTRPGKNLTDDTGKKEDLRVQESKMNKKDKSVSRVKLAEVLKYKIQEQVNARNTAEKLLSEGPIANVWDRIKNAGTSVGQKMGLAGQVAQSGQKMGVDENSKKASQELIKVLGKVNQHRQKFNSSVLKNSETMNTYHDLVLNAVQMYKQTQSVLGPFGQQIVRQIQDAIGNLVYDLRSEKDQIDTFLQHLKSAGMTGELDPTLLGAAAKKRAQTAREIENPGGTAAIKRNIPGLGGTTDHVQRQAAMYKYKTGDIPGAMNDLSNLFARQAQRDKKKSSVKKK